MDAQALLECLRESAGDPDWAGSRNEWVKSLASGKKGKVGENLVSAVLGAAPAKNNKAGYDLALDGMRIEVKLACTGKKNGYPYIQWPQIRPEDPYTHIAFVAVYPDKTRVFLVPKEDIPEEAMLHMHGRDKSLGIFCITTRKLDELFDWMTKHEIGQDKT